MLMVRDFLWALFIDDFPECARGDALACAGVIPWGKAIGLPAKVIRKLVSKADDTVQAGRSARKTGKAGCSSFVPGTRVTMADGTTKPIEDVKVGDKVIATDPESGRTRAEPVIAVITSKGAKNLVRVTVDTDGARGDEVGVVVATENHPFWAPGSDEWQDAGSLTPGQWLRTSEGRLVQVTAIRKWSASDQRVHNLTVANVHTYHVEAGRQDLLVHNVGPCIPGPARYHDEEGLSHSFDRHAQQWYGKEVKKEKLLDDWTNLIERGMKSTKVVLWKTGSTETYGHLMRVDGKWFFVQFARSDGRLMTAFVPNQAQLRRILSLLK